MIARVVTVLATAAYVLAIPDTGIPIFALARNPDYTPSPYQVPVPKIQEEEPYRAAEDYPAQEIITELQRQPTIFIAQEPYLAGPRHQAPRVYRNQRPVNTPARYQSPAYRQEPVYEHPAQYQFSYGIKDGYSGNDFGHQETRDGDDTQGNYYVHLPDGRLQKVNYAVQGDSGYVAEVTYEGEAKHPEPQPLPSYNPAPSYGPVPSYGGARSYDPHPSFRSLHLPPVRNSYPLHF